MAREEDSFVKLKESVKTKIDLLENIPIYCIIEVPPRAEDFKWELPLSLMFLNDSSSPANL